MSDENFESLSIADEKIAGQLRGVSDEVLKSFSFPIYGGDRASVREVDEDGFPIYGREDETALDLSELQRVCRKKAMDNPQISSHIRDIMGRMAGWGFGFYSSHFDLQTILDEISEDPRNDLYQNFPKFCARAEMEGELFLLLSVHEDGFIEVDFFSPESIQGGKQQDGIIYHPRKQNFPLMYYTKRHEYNSEGSLVTTDMLIPSINLAYYPDLFNEVKNIEDVSNDKLKYCRSSSPKFKKLNGFNRFMVHWNKGFLTRRNASHIRTTLKWVNYYEELKKFEIDHKKSSGAYLWVISIDNIQNFRQWLNMTEEERKKTGIMQPKDPGGTMILPPGMTMTVENPKLPSISDEDTDIMQMVSSGLQKPQDTMLGDYRSSYASVKAAQGPQGDRINDELHYFRLFLIYTFWRGILYLKSVIDPKLEYVRKVDQAVDFKNKKPVMKKVDAELYKLIDVSLPVSRLEDIESMAKAMLGSKHGSLVEVLDIPREEIANRLGFSNYVWLRKKKATEDELYPETLSVDDAADVADANQSGKEESKDSEKKKGGEADKK